MKTAIISVATALLFLTSTTSAAEQCKALPIDAAWPSSEAWKTELPMAIARGPQTSPTRPDYRVEAKSAADVQAAVKFAAKYNMRLSILNTGHDALARNDAPSGILLTLEGLKGWRVEQSFTPSEAGAPVIKANHFEVGVSGKGLYKRHEHKAVTIGGGVTTQELNNALEEAGIVTMGADNGGVSVAGGWGQCGGNGPLTTYHGLGIDNVLEYHVVTADGNLKIANKNSNSDLFWALRGGCGGTFGVVVQATVKAFPNPKMVVANYWYNATDDMGVFNGAAHLHKNMPALNGKGVQGYYQLFPKAMKGTFHVAGEKATEEYAKATMGPVFETLKSTSGVLASSLTVKYREFATYKGYYDAVWGPLESTTKRIQPGGLQPADSRLLDKEALEHPDTAAVLKQIFPSGMGGMIRASLIAGGEVSKLGSDTSAHPTWRRALLSVTAAGKSDIAPLAKMAKGMGAYPNEGGFLDENWKDTFWGPNYPKLSAIKTKYDPDFVFWVTPGVNADQMAVNVDGRLCRVNGSVATSPPPKGDNQNQYRFDPTAFKDMAPFPKSG